MTGWFEAAGVVEVLIVDDNPIVRAALGGFLAASERVRVVGEAANGLDALDLARRLRPAVVLLDYRMPLADGLSVISQLSQYAAVLVTTSDESVPVVTGMLQGGARGYLVHGQFDPDELLRAVTAVASGQGWLSPTAVGVATSLLRERPGRQDREREQATRRWSAQQQYGLTRRERQVLDLLTQGLGNASIAARLGLSEKTVKNHLSHAYAKLGVASRTEAIVTWSG
ncbi:LuxR C-terminal-related transcriptional regulator [Streptacidiphilus sp. PAMC 29251]